MREGYDAMATSPLFALREMRKLRSVLSPLAITTGKYETGETILGEGMVTRDVLLVLEGRAGIFRHGVMREARRRSETIAEELAVSGSRSLYCVRALEACSIAFVPLREIRAIEEFRENLERIIARRLIESEEMNAILRQKTVKEKLAAYLSLQAKLHHHATFLLAMTKRELAEVLSVERGSLRVAIESLVKEGRLKVSGRTYTLET